MARNACGSELCCLTPGTSLPSMLRCEKARRTLATLARALCIVHARRCCRTVAVCPEPRAGVCRGACVREHCESRGVPPLSESLDCLELRLCVMGSPMTCDNVRSLADGADGTAFVYSIAFVGVCFK